MGLHGSPQNAAGNGAAGRHVGTSTGVFKSHSGWSSSPWRSRFGVAMSPSSTSSSSALAGGDLLDLPSSLPGSWFFLPFPPISLPLVGWIGVLPNPGRPVGNLNLTVIEVLY